MKKIIALVLLVWCGSIQAIPLTWTLNNVVFDDGGTAHGSFVYDSDTEDLTEVEIWTTAGSSYEGYAYDDCYFDFFHPGSNGCTIDRQLGTGYEQLFIFEDAVESESTGKYLVFGLDGLPSNAGGVLEIVGGCAGFTGCEQWDNQDQQRAIVSGYISAVPIPAAVWLFGSALFGLGWMRRKKVWLDSE